MASGHWGLERHRQPRPGYQASLNSSGAWEVRVGGGATGYILTGPTVPLNTWTHMAVSFDGSTLRLYVNGAQAASMAATYVVNPTAAFGIGALDYSGTWGDFFTGQIDEAALYGTALSASRIQAHYEAR
jgi:hypothetical protein